MPTQSGPHSPQQTLLQACGLLFLFRAFLRSEGEAQRAIWEEQILRLIAELVPCTGGSVLLGAPDSDIPEDCVAVPLCVRDAPSGKSRSFA
jgi:hypothetical protein